MGDPPPARNLASMNSRQPVESEEPSSSSPTDQELVEGLRAGDTPKAEALYRRIYPAISRTLRRICRFSAADYDDLVQLSFERVVKTLVEHRFAGACSLTTWASSIAAHVALDMLRARTRERRLFNMGEPRLTDDGPEVGLDPERSLEARAELRRLQSVLGRMNGNQARTLVLHDVLGHDLAEIAVVTGVSQAAAQSRLVRGRKELIRRCRATMARKTS